MGHIVVIVGYDPAHIYPSDPNPIPSFKVKSSDENAGKVEWIPVNRMTWFQSVVTEEVYEAVTYDRLGPNGLQKIDQNGQIYFINRINVIRSLQSAHQVETNKQLGTNFNQRTGILLKDSGFVLKLKKTCQCQGDTCQN